MEMPLANIFTWVGTVYLVIMSTIAVFVTVYDKRIAIHNRKLRPPKKKKQRVPEKTLLLLGALSGCIAMYLTMRIIHHKTKHMKFMAGLPLIMLTEVLIVFFAWRLIF